MAQVATFAFSGIEANPVEVQVQLSSGAPNFLIVGLADKAVAEARETGASGVPRHGPCSAAAANFDQFEAR